VTIAQLHRRGRLTASRDLMLASVRPQRRYHHGKKIRPGTPDLPNDPACLVNKRSGHCIVPLVCKYYNISMHNPPDNLSESPPWPPGSSNAPDPSRYSGDIVRSMGLHVNHISDDLHIFPPHLLTPTPLNCESERWNNDHRRQIGVPFLQHEVFQMCVASWAIGQLGYWRISPEFRAPRSLSDPNLCFAGGFGIIRWSV